jgi:alkylation response protein AidB-like acyl-CoA dehydrogenase
MGRLQTTEGLTETQVELLALVRQFVDEQIIPVATELEHKDEYPAEIVEGMKEMGIFGLMIPEEYGGLGESLLTYALDGRGDRPRLDERLGHHQHPLHRGLHADEHGTEAQKQHYLPKMATGEIRGAFSMSEPGLGSDVAAIRTKAVRQGDSENWVIDGQKMWLTNGGTSNLVAPSSSRPISARAASTRT